MTENNARHLPISRSLMLEPLREGWWRAPSVPNEKRPVVFGGQLLGQILVAAAKAQPDKLPASIHTVFARAGNVAHPVDLEVTTAHAGRSLGTVEVRAHQGDRLLAPAIVMLDAVEPDLIRHQTEMASVAGPDDCVPSDLMVEEGTEIRIVGNVDIRTTEVTGPPTLGVWARHEANTDDRALHRALLSWWTDPFLIGAAMRPHEGYGQSIAHRTISTGVLAHTLTFHEDVDATGWHLYTQDSVHAGHGRTYGIGSVYSQDGRLVASFAQESMIRHLAATADHSSNTVM
jgi:acyl-CoA thioesterase II